MRFTGLFHREAILNDEDWKRELRKQRRLEALGTNEPKCGLCGNSDWRCLELHHVAGRKSDDVTSIVCRNCHRRLSDEQRGHPAPQADADPMLDAIGRFLLGLADMLDAILERLRTFGRALMDGAALVGGPQ